jgi:hypothetical protein
MKMPKENKIVESKVQHDKMSVSSQFTLQLLGMLVGFIYSKTTPNCQQTMHENPQVIPYTTAL